MNDLNLDIYSDNFGEWNEEGFGEGSWVDTAMSLGQKVADANAAKRKAANERATQAAIMANAQRQAQTQNRRVMPQVTDNTMMYVGIGVAVIVIGGGAYLLLRKRS